jgi:cytochrome P450
VPELQRRGQVCFFLESWRAYGDIVRFRLGPFVGHILAHPDHIQQVLAGNAHNYSKGPSYAKAQSVIGCGLLTSEGDLWRRQRRLVQPSFTQRSTLPLAGTMISTIEAMLGRWEIAARDRTVLAINREMAQLALTIIGQTIFSADLDDVVQAILTAAVDVSAFVNHRLASFLDVPLALPTPANRRFKRAVRSFDTVVYQLIAARRGQQRDTTDLLDRLLEARDEDGRSMPDQQIRDEVLTLLLAGHETSAIALSWIWYLLAQYPEVEHSLHAELAAVLGDRRASADDLALLPYTRMVVEETLRLYPPVWTFPRAAIADDLIGGYYIPAGSLIFPSQYLTHRHPDFWENPGRFEPERFTPERSAHRARYAYYPFGGGPRSCIGSHFAMLELCLVVATVAQRFHLSLRPGPPIEPMSMVTLHPSRDILMTVEAK